MRVLRIVYSEVGLAAMRDVCDAYETGPGLAEDIAVN